ncbi:hypothetical protein KAR91_16015 [Candidatus Pacearchaeota archaeon]|nr:hypothetical protein [Candidatus Pacearchaeota archaeon]
MKTIDQTILCKDKGDCQRAVVATLFDLEIEQVPHFRLFSDDTWFNVYWYFLYALGWEYMGYHTPNRSKLELEDSVNGFFEATVESKTFTDRTHSVIIDIIGTVVHDPNPNKKWLGINVLESGELKGWYVITPRKK